MCVTKAGSFVLPRCGTGARNGQSVSTSRRSSGTRAATSRTLSAFLNVTMPEIDTYQPRSSAPRARSHDSVKQCSTPMVPRCRRSRFERIGFRRARVDDDRERRVARDVEMRRKTVALVSAHVIGIDLEVVEPGFTDANDPLMPRRFAYPVERNARARAFRMQSSAGPYVWMTLGQLDHRGLGIGIHADAQKLSNADGARSRQAGVSVVEIVQMAVRIDQHTYMVCVWRSD